jgi:glycosyltransferase involved in cell wall biosynthesis
MPDPSLSVVVPMFNAASTIADTLDSLIAQTFTGWRCVVVNDGSTDAGPAIVDDYARRDPRITMISQANRGLSGARNTGMDHALAHNAEFIHFLDSDDWMSPDAYQRLLPACDTTGAAYAGYELCGPDAASLGRQSPMSAPYVGLDEQVQWNRTATHAMVFRADLIADMRFDESLRCVEDYDFWLRLATRGVRLKGVERILCGYRLRPDSISKNFSGMCSAYESVLRRNVQRALDAGWGSKIDLSEKRLRRAMGAVNLGYATMTALLDPSPAKARAAALLATQCHPESYSAAELAQAASTALVFGACTAPDVDGQRERRWLTALRCWWVRCAEEGWAEFTDVDAALVELSRKIVHPDAIVDRLMDEARHAGAPEAGLIVLGCEKFGRRLARASLRRGWRTLVLDGFSSRPDLDLLEPAPALRLAERPGAIDQSLRNAFAGAPVVHGLMSPADRAAGEAALADSAIRPGLRTDWTAHRDAIGDANLASMRAALSHRLAKAG